MELNAVQIKKTFKGKKKASKRKKTRKCYAYSNIRHITRNCLLKNKIEKQHFDMVNI